MKAKLITSVEFNEDFYDEEARDKHYEDHVNGDRDEWPVGHFNSPREYEISANIFALTKSDSSDINSNNEVIGFMQRDGSILKYNKVKKEMVIYKIDKRIKPGVKIITYFKSDDRKYIKRFNEKYLRDLKKFE